MMNQQKIALLTDSCADLKLEHIGDDPIFVVPLIISWQGTKYEDGVTITAEEVYDRARTELPKTSLPRPQTVYQTLERIRNLGYQKVIAVMLSSGLSGTYNMVRLAAQDFRELEIHVVDSLSGAIGSGAIVLQLMEYIKRDFAWERLKTIALRLVENTKVFFSLDTLEYLKKGGRIGKVTAMAGTVLNLKPIIAFEPNGELGSVAKCRGSRQAHSKLIELARQVREGHKRYILLTAHGGAPEAYPDYRAEVLRYFTDFEKHIESTIDATLAAYTGPGLLGAGIVILDGVEDA
ncbi:MAG: DegV family protein [Oscillospiraceae bacterium]|nr:DegV family protein [Oscillospiraceae bacterium]